MARCLGQLWSNWCRTVQTVLYVWWSGDLCERGSWLGEGLECPSHPGAETSVGVVGVPMSIELEAQGCTGSRYYRVVGCYGGKW